jgi:AhpC/TSA family protein
VPGPRFSGFQRIPSRRWDRFKAKHQLAIVLASDETHNVLEAYGVWQQKTLYGRKFMGTVRATFLIGARSAYCPHVAQSLSCRPRRGRARGNKNALSAARMQMINRTVRNRPETAGSISKLLTLIK